MHSVPTVSQTSPGLDLLIAAEEIDGDDVERTDAVAVMLATGQLVVRRDGWSVRPFAVAA